MNAAKLALLSLGLMLAACSASKPMDEARASVTLMTFNAQNLFDNIDDPVKDDKAYLPLAAKQNDAHRAACAEISNRYWRAECLELDWSDEAVNHKLGVLAEVIRQVNGGRGADVIALQEIENKYILERLRNEHLADLGYRESILIEGTDKRGIDVAFLSRLPLVGTPILHPLKIRIRQDRARDTRGILEARFVLPDGSTMTGYSVHFPAPFHPTEMRVAAYRHLQSLRATLPDDDVVFAAGDFNTTSTEDAREKLLDNYVRSDWQVAHDYCKGCPGTYYYAPVDNWSFLDTIIVASGSTGAWQLQPGSVVIPRGVPAQTTTEVTTEVSPARYDSAARQGASDHWPLIVTLSSEAR